MTHDILIAGDGLSGLTMALALAQAGLDCAVMGPHLVHKNETTSEDARTTAIMQDGIEFLDQIGVWPDLKDDAAPLRYMRLVSGEKEIVFDATNIGLSQFGYNIPNSVLKQVLLTHLHRHKRVTLLSGMVTAVDFPRAEDRPQRVSLRTEQGVSYQTRLVIAADGAKSVVREAAKLDCTIHDPQQSAVVGWIKTERPHDFTSTEFYYRGGPFTVVPTPDPHIMTLVYCDRAENLADVTALSDDAFDAHLTDMTQGRFGDVHFTGRKQYWPIRSLRASTLVAPHIALIGETAHMMPPLAAQGFNTSLRDIQILCDALSRAVAVGSDIADMAVLRHYERARRFDIQARSRAVNGLNDMIRRDDGIGRSLHGFGFFLLDKMKPLKNMVMKVALSPRASVKPSGRI
jgi:2-octaprenyl-6-methoxyphenol hydroxylase